MKKERAGSVAIRAENGLSTRPQLCIFADHPLNASFFFLFFFLESHLSA